jgi:arylsulfatase A-like enzyme
MSPVGRPPAGPRARLGPALTLGAALLGAALAGLVTFAWPSNPGVHLSAAERAGAAQGVALVGLALGVLAAVVGRGRGAAAAVLLPLAALGLVATLPVSGRAVVHVAPSWLVLGAAALLTALALLRSALAELVPWALGVGALGAAALSWRGAPLRPAPLPLEARPPVFILTLDTVRADVFDFIEPEGLEGLGAARTPHLRALAATARVFTRAYAPAALTGPTHASLFSGHTPWEHGVWDNGEPMPVRGPDGGPLPWLPSWFAARGYETVGVVSVGVLGHRAGFSRGFDVYDSVFAERLAVGHPLLRAVGHRPVDPEHFSRPGRATLDVLRAIPKARGPRLTWVHLFDAHWPYTPGAEARGRWGLGVDEAIQTADLMRAHGPGRPMSLAVVERGRRLYLAEIEELDAIVGELLAEVPEDALLVIVGDHGESLGEQGLHFSHGALASGASTRVPLLVRAPGLTPGVERRTVSTVDLLPTVLTLVGAPLPGRRTWLAPEGPVWSASARSAGGEAEACPSAGALAPAPLARGAQPLGGLLAVARRDDDLHVIASCWEPVGQASAVGDPLELQPWPAPAGISPSALPKPPGLAPAPGLETRAMLEALGYLSPEP